MDNYCIPSDIFIHQDMLEEVTCGIGTGVMNDPVVLPCTHRFCRKCIEHWLSKNSICPTCRSPTDKINLKNDEGVWKIICSYKVKCDNGECKWQGKYGERVMHIEKYCEFTFVKCPNGCGLELLRKELEAHIKECPESSNPCEKCGKSIKRNQTEMHKNECPNEPIDCPNNCGLKIARSKIEEHIKKECENVTEVCKYSLGGCDFSGTRKALNEHYKQNMEKHLESVNTRLSEIFGTLLAIKAEQSQMKIKQAELEAKLKQKENAEEIPEARENDEDEKKPEIIPKFYPHMSASSEINDNIPKSYSPPIKPKGKSRKNKVKYANDDEELNNFGNLPHNNAPNAFSHAQSQIIDYNNPSYEEKRRKKHPCKQQ